MQTTVEITLNGVEMTVTGDYDPLIPAKTTGPLELCHDEEGGEFTPDAVIVGGVDISELLDGAYYSKAENGRLVHGSHIMDLIANDAYDAAVRQAEEQRESDAEDRAEHWRMAA